MRHLPQNFLPGDKLELSLAVTAEVRANEESDDGRLLILRVVGLKNRSNGKDVLWSCGPNDSIELAVEVGARERLLAVGLSARQRKKLKERFAGLTEAEANELLGEITGNQTGGQHDNGRTESIRQADEGTNAVGKENAT